MGEVAFKHDIEEERKKPDLAMLGACQESHLMENPEPNQCLTTQILNYVTSVANRAPPPFFSVYLKYLPLWGSGKLLVSGPQR